MAYFEDLQPCTEFTSEWTNLLAVGWLSKDRPFPKGKLDAALVQRLETLLQNVWQPRGSFAGTHWCQLCKGGFDRRRGDSNLFIPAAGRVFVAPGLIVHYIARHGYAPPTEFIEAVLACPPMGSPQYRAAISQHHPSQPGDFDLLSLPVLEGIAPVRLRPGMYIGSTDSQGLSHLLLELVSNSIDQHLSGAATRVRVEIDAAGWVEVEDDGTGLPVEAPIHGLPPLEAIFTRLHSTPTLDEHHPHVHARAGTSGVGAAVVSALSARFEVETWRKGHSYAAVLERGAVVQPLVDTGSTERHGTRIRYRADEAIFGDTTHDLASLEARFEELGTLLPQLDLRFRGRAMQRKEGLTGWLAEIAPDTLTQTRISIAGASHGVDVEVALAWSPRGARRVRSFVNFAATAQNGTHVEGLIDAIEAAAPTRAIATRVLNQLAGLVHVRLLHPRFQGPTKAQLDVESARMAVASVVAGQLKLMPWWWDRVLEAMR